MTLSHFIREHIDDIVAEWESFAQTQLPAATPMSDLELRNDVVEILSAIAEDIGKKQSPREQYAKSRGAVLHKAHNSAASKHGSFRHRNGFTFLQLTAEYRALRATVLRLWLQHIAMDSDKVADDVIRFSEAIDQALAESVVTYSAQMARTRDLFLAILGHDLRAPLATVATAGELLKRSDLSASQRLDIGDMVDRSAKLMGEITKDLLEFARTQLGSNIPINPGEGDLREVCNTALEGARAVYPSCPFHLGTEGDLNGSFDSVRLHQLVTNLLLNAAQYRSEHSAVAILAKGEGSTLTMRVQNFGTVIPEESLESIFNPLTQLARRPDSNPRPTTSLGLGLFVAREITIAHNGTITVKSSETAGTEFTVRLPRKAPQSREKA